MYISDIEEKKTGETKQGRSVKANPRRAPLYTALRYLGAALLCAVFGIIYEAFSFGVYSPFMVFAFVFPLLLGAFPNLLIALFAPDLYPGTISRYVYHAGVSTLTVGSIFWGVLEIYGTTSPLENVYLILGSILVGSGAVGFIVFSVKHK